MRHELERHLASSRGQPRNLLATMASATRAQTIAVLLTLLLLQLQQQRSRMKLLLLLMLRLRPGLGAMVVVPCRPTGETPAAAAATTSRTRRRLDDGRDDMFVLIVLGLLVGKEFLLTILGVQSCELVVVAQKI